MNREQEEALAALFALVPRAQPVTANGALNHTPALLETWFGLSSAQAQAWLSGLNDQRRNVETQFIEWAADNPLDSAFVFLGTAAAAFYAAEKGINPRIETYVDAFYFISTCASVGYADIFAVTQTGRSIAALVMIIGPSLADRTLNPAVIKRDQGKE
jgi:hypothetical protein